MIPYIGDYKASSTVRYPWATNGANGASITRATNGNIRVYKNTSTTQRTSSNGITDTEDFDSLTGLHMLAIDLSDNSDAGFYTASNDYFVVLEGAVIDGQTVNAPLFAFSIENRTPRADVVQFGGTNGTFSGGRPEVNASHLAGTAYASADLSSTMKTSVQTKADDALTNYAGAVGVARQDTVLETTGQIANVQTDVTAIKGYVDTEIASIISSLSTLTGYVDTEIATLLTNVSTLLTNLATVSGYVDTEVASILAAVDTEVASILAAVDTEIASIQTAVNAIKAKTDNLPADPADASDIMNALTVIDDFIDTEVAAIKTVTDKLDTALEQDGAVYRYTTNALEQAPAGGGGGGTGAGIK